MTRPLHHHAYLVLPRVARRPLIYLLAAVVVASPLSSAPAMSTTHLSAAHSRPPTADARSPPPSFDEPDARHPPPRSFSQPQLPYHFQPPAAPGSAAPSLHHLTLPRHLTPALRDSFAPMCASARTSYTRVDATATVPGTPRAEAEQLQDLPVLAAAEGTAEGADNEKETDGAGDEVLPALPQAVLTFLLVSGRRRTMAFDPETTIGRMKELVWNAWPNGESSAFFPLILCFASSAHASVLSLSCMSIHDRSLHSNSLDLALHRDATAPRPPRACISPRWSRRSVREPPSTPSFSPTSTPVCTCYASPWPAWRGHRYAVLLRDQPQSTI